jgi:hypothetical protein
MSALIQRGDTAIARCRVLRELMARSDTLGRGLVGLLQSLY